MQTMKTPGKTLLLIALTLISLALSACVDVDDAQPAVALEAMLSADQATLIVQGIGDAENATFSSDGRLFVTGGENVYEIARVGSGFAAKPLYAGTCNFTGIAERSGFLYTACVEGSLIGGTPHLLAAALTAEPQFNVIYDFKRTAIPNGIAFDERGRLFVTDFTPLLGKIVALSFDAKAPLKVTHEEVWHDMDHWLANGLKIFRGSVYLTDLSDLKVIPIRSDGSAGRARVLASRAAVLDDLYVDDKRVLVGDFYGGQLVAYAHNGALLAETEALFSAPSSITAGREPLVPAGTWVITDKGELGELRSEDGNRVSLFQSTTRAFVP